MNSSRRDVEHLKEQVLLSVPHIPENIDGHADPVAAGSDDLDFSGIHTGFLCLLVAEAGFEPAAC